MRDEAVAGPAQAPVHGGSLPGGAGDGSPLQARAAFLANWDWQSVIRINRGACERGGAQHGPNSETQAACAADWDARHRTGLTLGESLDLLRAFHRRAPFLFFNGNTFATSGRELALVILSELPTVRRRAAASAVAHYIAGVLDREGMVAVVEELCRSADLAPGMRVKTLRGSARGVIVRRLADGRVVWRADGAAGELTALSESLLAE